MRKSYEVGISPKINLCNSVEVLTNSFGTVISGKQPHNWIAQTARFAIYSSSMDPFTCKRPELCTRFSPLSQSGESNNKRVKPG